MSCRGIRSPSHEQQRLRRGNVLIRFTLDHPESQDHVTKKSDDNAGERRSDISVSYRHRHRSHQNTPPVTFITSSSPHLDSSSPSISMAPSGDKTKNGRWKGTAEWDSPSAGYDVTDGNGCLVSCFPNCRKPNYRGGQMMTGTILIKPVHRVTICGVFVKMWGIESTKWRSRERVYFGERIFFKQMVVIVKNRLTNLDTKWYKYDFEYQLPADLPPSFKMADGSRRYRACAVISQPYGPDLEGHQVGFSLVGNSAVGLAPNHLREEYEIRFSTNHPSTHVKCSCQNKSKTPPTSTIPPSLPSSPPVMTSSSRSTLYQRSLSKLSPSSSSSPWSPFATITSACMKFLRCSCCCQGGGADQMIKYRSGQVDQSYRSNDYLNLEPCGHVGQLLRFNSDINSNNEVPTMEVLSDVQQVKEAISGSLRISGRVFAPLDTVNVLCTVENHESSSDLLCCLKLIRIAKFTAREASHPNSRKGLAHPRRFKIEPKTKMAEEELLKTEEISVPPEEIRCFGFRFTVPYKIIGNTTTYACSNQTNSRETLGSSSSTDTADDELISLFYFCLMEIQPTSSNSSTGLDVITVPIEIRFVDRIRDT